MTTSNTPEEFCSDRTLELDSLYDPPAERTQKAVLSELFAMHIAYLEAATFFCLATGSDGGLDASPRGGPPGFVRMLDRRTVCYADWPGNNRIESMRNLQSDDRLGMLFLYPGLEIFMRINGRGRLSVEPSLLEKLKEGERVPKTATVVSIDQVIVHCGKAVNRAKLWQDESRLGRHALPSIGQMVAELTRLGDPQATVSEGEIAQIDKHYLHSVRNDLY